MAEKIPLIDVALKIKRSYDATCRLVLTGVLDGGKDQRGRWLVSRESVDRFLELEAANRSEQAAPLSAA